MLNLWLVVLLGFVASARGNYNTCYSSNGAEKQIKDICMQKPEYFTPSGLGIPNLNLSPLTVLPIIGITNGVFGSVTFNKLSLSKDFAMLSIDFTAAISCKEVKNLQLSISVDLSVSWGTSLDGCLQAIAGDISIKIAPHSNSIGVIPDMLVNLLVNACRPLLKTHFGACFNGILGIFNANLQTGGALVSGTLMNIFATSVTVTNGVLSVTHTVQDVLGAVIKYPGNTFFPVFQVGEVWGCGFNAEQIAFLWNYSPKIYTWKWPACLIQSYFGLDVPLGSNVNFALSLGNALSINVDSNGIKIRAEVNVEVTADSGNPLLRLTATVALSANLTARDGRIGLDYVGLSTEVNWALTWQHTGCSCTNVLNSLLVNLNISLDLAFRGFVGNFGSLIPLGIPPCYQVNYKPFGKCYNSEGDKKGYCSVIYRVAS